MGIEEKIGQLQRLKGLQEKIRATSVSLEELTQEHDALAKLVGEKPISGKKRSTKSELEDLREKIVGFCSQGRKMAELFTHLPMFGEQSIRRQVMLLCEDGELRKVGGGRLTKYITPTIA